MNKDFVFFYVGRKIKDSYMLFILPKYGNIQENHGRSLRFSFAIVSLKDDTHWYGQFTTQRDTNPKKLNLFPVRPFLCILTDFP